MVRPSAVIISAMAVVIAVLLWALVYFARDEWRLQAEAPEDELPVESAVERHNGFAAVRIDEASQAASGIAIAVLKPASAHASAQLYGIVIGIQPLIDLRGRYIAAVSEARGLRAAVANSDAEYRRVKQLFEDDRNVAQRTVQAAEAQLKADEARFAAAEQQIAAAHASIRANWGPVLANWATNPESAAFESLLQQRDFLVALNIPYDLHAPSAKAALTISALGSDAQPRSARFVSAAPQTDGVLPGPAFFYTTSASGLQIGMRVSGHMRLAGEARDGIVVPSAAVVWHGGKAWAYVKEDEELFVRKEVDTSQEMPGGWFNGSGFEPDEEVVVSGAQLLLSEELKYQIRNENED